MEYPYVKYEGPIISRNDAESLGLVRYFTGRPCVNGHISERYIKGSCVTCNFKRSRDRARNNGSIPRGAPSDVDIITLYFGDAISRSDAKVSGDSFYFTGSPCTRGHIAERSTASGSCVECKRVGAKARRARRKDEYSKYNRDWVSENRDKVRAFGKKRYHLERSAKGNCSKEDADKIFESQRGLCVYCLCDLSKTAPHLDHIMPIYLGGSNHAWNRQYLCHSCNSKKGSKHPVKFSDEMTRDAEGAE